jgi:transposase
MLNEETRTAILLLHERGASLRAIAKALSISRHAARKVVAAGNAEVPGLVRPSQADPWHEAILQEHARFRGKLVLVHRELGKRGAGFSYQVLTDYCRRHGIGVKAKIPSGSYTFEPGEEMQTDTSPHRVKVGGQERKAQCACLVLAFSRMVFVQYYPSFDRFWCKAFLTAALEFFGGACRRCVIDNTSVIVGAGVGAAMIPAPEMAAFALRFGFEFKAHAIGHANRKARVERAFHYVENNLLPGREFKDWEDLNREARAWSEAANARLKPSLHARPIDLFARERLALKPLPEYVPAVYRNHDRTVDAEGFVHVGGNRFSVPSRLIGKMLEVREYADRIEAFEGHTRVAQHLRPCDAKDLRLTDPAHHPKWRERRKPGPGPEESELLRVEPRLEPYLAALKAKRPGQAIRAMKRLLGMLRDYPREPFLRAVATALDYGLFDLDRLDGMVLRNTARDYFVLSDAIEGGQ